MNSAIVVTEPLPQDVHDEIGWRGAELLGNLAHAYIYAQRTADGRIAFGGPGKPYRYGSDGTCTAAPSRRRSTRSPGCCTSSSRRPAGWPSSTPGAACWPCHADWSTTVHVDPRTGLGWAGGYVGSGLTTTNLAGARCATWCSAPTPS
jgi:glycine/D-amino acid oxidase-like deaminating enzyme